MKPRGSVRGRIGGLAAGHAVISLLGCALIFSGYAVEGRRPALLLFLLLLYLPAGWLASYFRRWPRPDGPTGVKAVLYPSLWAWGAALTGILLFFGSTGLAIYFDGRSADAAAWMAVAAGVGWVLLISTVFLASPSFLLMLMATFASINGLPLWLWPLCILPAGALPPLLFFLGSLLPKKRLTSGEIVIE